MTALATMVEAPAMPAESGGPVVYPRDAVLTIEQLVLALQLSKDTIEKADLPTIYIGRLRRYLYGQVLDCLAERAR